MIKRTKLEIYAYAQYGTIKDFSEIIGVTPVTLWKWIVKRAKPSKRHAQNIERLTNGAITEDYLRNRMD
jgi:DNA-binding transcriptional regulator YdaS (Cro superfamily)